ncbi:hypothetical protein JZ751_008883, partial [Albula glossodonta]
MGTQMVATETAIALSHFHVCEEAVILLHARTTSASDDVSEKEDELPFLIKASTVLAAGLVEVPLCSSALT